MRRRPKIALLCEEAQHPSEGCRESFAQSRALTARRMAALESQHQTLRSRGRSPRHDWEPDPATTTQQHRTRTHGHMHTSGESRKPTKSGETRPRRLGDSANQRNSPRSWWVPVGIAMMLRTQAEQASRHVRELLAAQLGRNRRDAGGSLEIRCRCSPSRNCKPLKRFDHLRAGHLHRKTTPRMSAAAAVATNVCSAFPMNEAAKAKHTARMWQRADPRARHAQHTIRLRRSVGEALSGTAG